MLERFRLNYEAFFGAMPSVHLAFFTDLKPYYETDDVICVHGGVEPGERLMNLQDTEVLIWGTAGFPDDYRGARSVVYGHWDNAAVDDAGRPWPRILSNRTFGIDTISKGVLTAMRFPDGMIFQSEKGL